MKPAAIPAVLLMGPTASGKSALAMALARRLGAEIVSVDSAQVYRGMDIGTAKPSAAERREVPHHLIDILDPAERYSAARFAADALRVVHEIRSRGRIPILVGGTMLYFRALLHGLADLPSADAQLRARITAQADREGWPALHARLAQLDPVTAARLSPNDAQRIQRALEIIELSGVAPSKSYGEARRAAVLSGPVMRVALELPDRAELHRRIESRFVAMMGRGLLEEVRALHARDDLHADLPSMRSVGYRQLWRHLEGEWNLDDAVQRAIFASRQLAKRQLTWLRSEQGLMRVDPGAAGIEERVCGDVLALLA